MEHALETFQNKLPTLAQIREHNEGSDVPPETAWIWGKDDEVGYWRPSVVATLTFSFFIFIDWAYKLAVTRESSRGEGERASGW